MKKKKKTKQKEIFPFAWTSLAARQLRLATCRPMDFCKRTLKIIFDFYVGRNAICSPHKILRNFCFQFLRWRLLVPLQEEMENLLRQNFVEKANYIMRNCDSRQLLFWYCCNHFWAYNKSERTTSALGSTKKEFVDLWAASNPPRVFCFYYCYFYWDIYPALAGASSCGE